MRASVCNADRAGKYRMEDVYDQRVMGYRHCGLDSGFTS